MLYVNLRTGEINNVKKKKLFQTKSNPKTLQAHLMGMLDETKNDKCSKNVTDIRHKRKNINMKL